jgi:hypothetical protein
MAHAGTRERLFAAGALAMVAVGIAARIVIWRSAYGVPDSDEAIPGLMARHLLSGNVSLFFWGQGYGGPIEPWLSAPINAVFGDTYVGLRLVAVILTAATSIVIWRVGLRTIGRHGAVTAAVVYWTFPVFSVWESIHERGFYSASILCGALALLLVLRIREHPSARDMAWLGAVVGIGVWQSFQLLPVLLPMLLWLGIRRRGSTRLVPYAVPGLLLGAVPIVVSNVRHSWWSLRLGADSGTQIGYGPQLKTFFTNPLPMALDLRAPCSQDWFITRPAALALYAALIVAFLVFAWQARNTRREVLGVVIAVFPLIYVLDPLTAIYLNPGYVLVLVPMLVLVLCAAVTTPLRGIWVMGAVLLLAAGTLIDLSTHGARSVNGRVIANCLTGASPSSGPPALPRDFGPLISTLRRLGIRRAYASYPIAYRLDYETDEQIVVGQGRLNALRVDSAGGVIPWEQDPNLNRWPAYDAIVGRTPQAPWIVDRTIDTGQLDLATFAKQHYHTARVGPFTLYLPPRAG